MSFVALPRFSRLTLALAALLGACAVDRVEQGAAVPEWRVGDAGPLTVGDREDGDTAVFYRVDDARWHAGRGVLVVADGGAFGLRVYSADGRLAAKGGRRGSGPGEFAGRLALIDAPGDSVAVWDSGQGRWTMFNVVDGGMRNVVGPLGQPTWFQSGMLVMSDVAAPPAWVTPLLIKRADSTDARVARIDRTGLLFVSEDASMRTWRVFRDSVAPIASMTVPEHFTLAHISDEVIVGILTDSLGLEQVAVRSLRRGPHEPSDRTPAPAPSSDDGPRNELRSFLRNMVVAQEMHFAERGGYTGSADSLRLPPLPDGAVVRILQRTDRGWSGAAWDKANGATCGMIIGLTVPPGWMEGEARCN